MPDRLSLLGGMRHVDAVAAPLQHEREPFREVDVVVDDEDGLIRLHQAVPQHTQWGYPAAPHANSQFGACPLTILARGHANLSARAVS